MQLTKSEYMQFLHCPKSFWWSKCHPEDDPEWESSGFLQKLISESEEVKQHVHKYFKSRKRKVQFQVDFETKDGLFTKIDMLEYKKDGQVVLYDITSANSKKSDLTDICFQKICAERSGQQIDQVKIIHLNGGYVRNGDIDPKSLIEIVDVTAKVKKLVAETSNEIDKALRCMRDNEIDQDGCDCIYETRSKHCDTFEIFNPNIPKPSIYNLPRVSAERIAEFVEEGIYRFS